MPNEPNPLYSRLHFLNHPYMITTKKTSKENEDLVTTRFTIEAMSYKQTTLFFGILHPI
jgi:hypothetical protein